jgi:hypothetical protein
VTVVYEPTVEGVNRAIFSYLEYRLEAVPLALASVALCGVPYVAAPLFTFALTLALVFGPVELGLHVLNRPAKSANIHACLLSICSPWPLHCAPPSISRSISVLASSSCLLSS